MKKHSGPEPPDSFYTDGIVGEKYVDCEYQEIDENGKLKSTTTTLGDSIDGLKRACVIVFFATWCSDCPPTINDVKISVRDKDILLIGLCVDENVKNMQGFLRRHQKYLFSTFDHVGYCGKDFMKYRVKHIPHLVVMTEKGRIIRNFIVELKKDDPNSYDVEKVFKEAIGKIEMIEEEIEGEKEEVEDEVIEIKPTKVTKSEDCGDRSSHPDPKGSLFQKKINTGKKKKK